MTFTLQYAFFRRAWAAARTRRIGYAYLGVALGALMQVPAKAACIGDTTALPAVEFHVVPQYTPAQVYLQWTPLLDHIGKAAKLCFELRVAPTISEFEQALFRGDADFAWLNPYHLVLARQKQGYVPLLADVKTRLAGVLVVRRDSKITALSELQGGAVAFPAPNAFAATLLPRALLAAQKIEIKPRFVTSHSNVYRAVINGDVVAGGAVNTTLAQEPAQVRELLRVLHTTADYISHPIAAHPRVPAAVRAALVAAFLKSKTDAAGRRLLEKVQLPMPALVTYEKDYAALETLNLGAFVSKAN